MQSTKLSDYLAQVLITPSMRPHNKGICSIVLAGQREDALVPSAGDDLLRALEACTQTGSYLFPVRAPSCWRAFQSASTTFNGRDMWLGEYGRNRRKLLRDVIRWLRERGL